MLCSSWISEEDDPAGMGFRHVCLAVENRMVPPLRLQQVLSCCWYHTSASVQQCLCEDLCIGVRCEIHRCSVVLVSHDAKKCRHNMGTQVQASGGVLPIHRAQLG